MCSLIFCACVDYYSVPIICILDLMSSVKNATKRQETLCDFILGTIEKPKICLKLPTIFSSSRARLGQLKHILRGSDLNNPDCMVIKAKLYTCREVQPKHQCLQSSRTKLGQPGHMFRGSDRKDTVCIITRAKLGQPKTC